MILAGDIGGTKTILAFFRAEGGRLRPIVEATFPSREHANLDEIVSKFVSAHNLPLTHACFGIAGPVKHGRCETTNLPWVVDAKALASKLGLETVGLMNDLEANAYGIAALAPKDFIVLNQGAKEAEGNAAIISAGTGLGEAGLYWDGQQHRPFACEGGHADFGPRNELQMELLRYLLRRFARVSWERVLSGPGLYNIYRFLHDTGHDREPTWLTEELRHQDPTTVIAQVALAGKCALCELALDLFVSLYGAEAGNLALKLMATGGVFIGGGIAPKIIEKLKDSTFIKAFTAKGRLQSLLEAMPVRIIVNDKAALLGAALWAAYTQVEPTQTNLSLVGHRL
ncbi:glucokinase [Scytonema hofmannii PCC 7110]|uniref:Glucokinase n=1 Tax=Scytonema hofmannii PCC 7110 TaxID=128403 RepID=A0A139X879_9CYAN|nr:glucokinase [Scytonema hofmannii]KYC40898.1 glucokinase [Scytonema hofmannii PCC 7110]